MVRFRAMAWVLLLAVEVADGFRRVARYEAVDHPCLARCKKRLVPMLGLQRVAKT